MPPAERETFLGEARRIAERVVQSAEALPEETMTSGAQAVHTIQGMDGWFANRMRGMVVTTPVVNEFLAQTPPRSVPRGIRKRAYGSSGFLMLWGAGVFLIGAFFVSLLLIPGIEFEDAGEIPGWLPYVLMVDPQDASRALWVEGWAMDAYDS